MLFVRAAIVVVSRGLASESTVGLGGAEGQEAEPCTNAMQQRLEPSSHRPVSGKVDKSPVTEWSSKNRE